MLLRRTLQALTLGTSASTQSRELPRDYHYRALDLRLTGTARSLTGTSTWKQDGILNYITNLKIIAGGSFVPFSMDLEQVFKANWYDAGMNAMTQGNAITSLATSAFVIDFRIDFTCGWRGQRAADRTLFNARKESSLFLEVTNGAITTALSGGTQDFSVTPSLEIVTNEETGLNDVRPVYKQTTIEQSFAGSSTDYAVEIPIGGFLHGIDFKVETAASGGTNSDTALTNVKLRTNGVSVSRNISFNQMKALNRRKYTPIAMFQHAGGAKPTLAGSYDTTGFARLDLDEKGVWELLDMRRESGITAVEVLLTVGAACLVRMNVREVVPVRR